LKPQQNIDLKKQQLTTVGSAPQFESLGLGFSEMSEFNAKPVQCWLCNLGFDKEGHRNVHLMDDHFTTKQSRKQSTTTTTISVPKGSPAMKIESSDDEPFKCPFCWVISKTDLRFNTHLFEYHTKENYKLYLKDVKEKVRPKQKSRPKCPECSEVFRNKKLLEEHVIKLHNIKHPIGPPEKKRPKSVCDLCGFTGSASGYQRHIFYQHGQTNNAQVFCQQCDGKPFLHKSDLERHLAVKHNHVAQLCTHCGKNFSTATLLKRHLASVHKIEDGVKKYQCSECDYTCFIHTQLKRHVFYTHRQHVESRFPCDQCGKNWYSACDRQHHIDVSHLGVKKYQCEHCDYVANNPRSIQKHTHYKHQDLGVRTCPICGTVEKSAADLLRHYESSHPGQPPLKVDEKYIFRCDLCNKILGCALSLYTHKKNTHNIKDTSILSTKKKLEND
jgi:uncharacterized C2H2 Zn-finger protein